jgi:hypothetical protein
MKKELKEYISVLYDEGFGYINEYEFHNKKIEHIILILHVIFK